MSIEIVPTQPSNPNYVQRTRLDGRDYLLTITYNARDCRWYLSVALENGEPLLSGVRIVASVNLLSGTSDIRKPPGRLVAVDLPAYSSTLGTPRDPGFGDLGAPERVRLYYFGAA